MSEPPVLIRKYENRRLYNVTNSRYVNLEDIAQMIRKGMDVRVEDATSGEDLTRLVLTQIIVETAKEKDSELPVDFLRQIIQLSGAASKGSFVKYLQTVSDVYQNAYRTLVPAFSPFSFFNPQGNVSPGLFSRQEQAPKPQESSESVDNLRRRIEELERLVSSGSQARDSKRRTGAKRKRTQRKRA